MFSLNYQLMTETLQRMHYTGMAQATIPSGPFAGGAILLQVQSGTILASVVVMPDGKHITDTQLIAERLLRVNVLEWDLMANPTSMSPANETKPPSQPLPASPPTSIPPSPTPPPGTQDAYPASTSPSDAGMLSPYSYPRRVPVDPAVMSVWPFMYRQVYNLSTGHYSEQDIGRLLRYPLAELVKVFDDLQRMNVIQRRT